MTMNSQGRGGATSAVRATADITSSNPIVTLSAAKGLFCFSQRQRFFASLRMTRSGPLVIGIHHVRRQLARDLFWNLRAQHDIAVGLLARHDVTALINQRD